MKRLLLLAPLAVAVSLGLTGLSGCSSASSAPPPPPPPPASVTSFTANPTSITDGTSATLTGVFQNGTGVITPGNLAATSGVAVTVNPTTTTTYTLTVTPSSGTAVTATATITVYPAPTITSFMASPASITTGSSDATLTGVFANGTGVITPGNLPATSGMPVTVSPTTTTTYTLTVTNAIGTAVTATATVTVYPAPTITSFVAGSATINAGTSTTLTGVFANGTGVITPGNLPATSGTGVPVSPTANTTYTLTVTNPAGTAVIAMVTITVNPVITSFTANPASITTGSSATLTAVFAGGTGVITPGNLPATSGVAVTVSPTATTPYILTVTPTSGTAITAQTTVTVYPVPAITSFTASPATIGSGGSSTLTGVFQNGTGVITPGNLPATSGTGVTVSPTATTTYKLTVTNAAETAVTAPATVTVASSVTVDLSSTGPTVTDKLLGMNLAAWYDVVGNATAVNTAFSQAGIQSIRWPGGSWSDDYHWGYQPGSSTLLAPYMCQTTSPVTGGWAGYSTFAEFVNAIPIAGQYDLALTADYGTDEACTGGGDPAEAAAWVAAAVTDGITVSHVTVGNEEYGSWETDLHSTPNDPTIYAAAVAGTNGYYASIKAASPTTKVGVDVDADNSTGGWDNTVLANAKGSYDFVEYHSYPEAPGSENDTFLVQQAAQNLTTDINTLKSELTKWGTPDTPIYVGEIGGPYSNPGKQSWSITQGLYAGQVLGEMMNEGVSRLTWWIGFGNCTSGNTWNDSTSLYGWQDFGAYNVFSDGPSDTDCPGAGPIGTMSPTARAFQLFSQMAVTGQTVLTASVAGDTTDVRAYAATNPKGTALLLFNRNETTSQQVEITLSGKSSSSGVTVTTYDKALYDQSGSPTGTPPDPAGTSTWAAPTIDNMGAQTLPLTLTLTPWSMNVVIIQ